MGRPISLFSDYKQSENRVTNYCGLILKLLYQENPGAFETVINNLCGGNGIKVNPVFEQQEKKESSVPDLCIEQPSFKIYFETKLSDWFYSGQLKEHIQSLGKESASTKILFLLTDEFDTDIDERIQECRELGQSEKIEISSITFMQFLRAINNIRPLTGSSFQASVKEFGDYLEEQNLLSSWQYRLDVVNCGGTRDEVERGIYACPDVGGQRHHKRSKYFGAYFGKKVNWIAEIRAIVSVKKGRKNAELKWNNGKEDRDKLINEAIEKLTACQPRRIQESDETDLQVFLLGDKFEVDYRKVSPGGMFSSKRYFDFPEIQSIEELRERLDKDKTWE